MTLTLQTPPVGAYLRQWRQRRRLSQLDLACEAEVSTRHLSFLETGRSTPSREMVLRLAERLQVPMRDRNVLLMAAGFAPIYPERPLEDSQLDAARTAIDLVLASQMPYPAFALDRAWRVIASNGALPQIYEGVAAELLEPPVNVMRLCLHPRGLAPRIVNLTEWADHLLHRLRQEADLSGDPTLAALLAEVTDYAPRGGDAGRRDGKLPVLLPLRLATSAGVLSFFSTTMVFGSAAEITLSEMAVELFFPADAETVDRVRQLEGSAGVS
jgi:transcriptional regulator with XRE-family HTH domain